MTTALQIINRAAELIGHKDPDETLGGNDVANFLAVLNDMVDAWNTQRLYIVTTTTVSGAVSANPVSIGSGQTLDTARPVRIESGWTRLNGLDHPIRRWLTAAEYDAIPNKSDTSDMPQAAFYSPGLPDGSIYLWPAPSASLSLHVRVMTQLSGFAAVSTAYDLAPGYKKALEYSLAEELAPGRRALDPQIARLAAMARRAIKVANYEPVLIEGSDARPIHRGFNIVTGQ